MKIVWFLDIGYTPPPSRGRRVPKCLMIECVLFIFLMA